MLNKTIAIIRAFLKNFVVDAEPGATAHSSGVYMEILEQRAPAQRRYARLQNFLIRSNTLYHQQSATKTLHQFFLHDLLTETEYG